MRAVIALFGLAAILGLVLAWEFTTPEDSPLPGDTALAAGPLQTARTGPDKSSPHGFDADALADIAASVTARPLFSANRRPAASSPSAATAQAGPEDVPRLTGVIVGPSGGWAIFAGADGKSHAAAPGDAIGAFKVRAIGPGMVTLTGSEGDRVLRPTYVTAPGAGSANTGSSEVTSSEFVAPATIRNGRARGSAR